MARSIANTEENSHQRCQELVHFMSCKFTRLFIHSPVHSFISSFIHLFVNLLMINLLTEIFAASCRQFQLSLARPPLQARLQLIGVPRHCQPINWSVTIEVRQSMLLITPHHHYPPRHSRPFHPPCYHSSPPTQFHPSQRSKIGVFANSKKTRFRQMDGRTNGQTDGRTNRRTDGPTDGPTDRRTDGPTDRRTEKWVIESCVRD